VLFATLQAIWPLHSATTDATLHPMKINSPQSLQAARDVLREHNGNWEEVRRSSVRRADGVILVPRPVKLQGTTKARPTTR
jgi:hypothetical protein